MGSNIDALVLASDTRLSVELNRGLEELQLGAVLKLQACASSRSCFTLSHRRAFASHWNRLDRATPLAVQTVKQETQWMAIDARGRPDLAPNCYPLLSHSGWWICPIGRW